jgi:hypothetical protein
MSKAAIVINWEADAHGLFKHSPGFPAGMTKGRKIFHPPFIFLPSREEK